MTRTITTATLGLALALTSLPVLAQSYGAGQPGFGNWEAQATATRTMASGPRRYRKLYHGVGFGQHRRTTATGGNPGGYSDRN